MKMITRCNIHPVNGHWNWTKNWGSLFRSNNWSRVDFWGWSCLNFMPWSE